jgi:MFS family permease
VRFRLGATGALALAAASTGVVVPALKLLVERTGHGSTAAGVFMAAHVVGGVIGAAFGARALRLAGSARKLAVVALAASVVVTLAMAALAPLGVRVALRFLDGGCHLLAITALVAAATTGNAERRASRAVMMGLAIVLGVAGGLGIGALLGHPEWSLVIAAVLSAASLLVVLAQVAAEPPPPEVQRSRERGPVAPSLLAFGERYVFGMLTVAMPFLASPGRVGAVLGVFMTASIAALPFARRYALRWGARRLALRSAIVFGLTLATAAVDLFAALPVALAWATVSGAAAGALYASALVLAARSTELEDRVRDMAALHAAGSAGHAAGALTAGVMLSVLPGPGLLAIALPGTAILALATLGVWLTVPTSDPIPSRTDENSAAPLPSARLVRE